MSVQAQATSDPGRTLVPPPQRTPSPSSLLKAAWPLELDRRQDVRLRLGRSVILQQTNGKVRLVILESLSLGGLGFRGAPERWERGWPVTFHLSHKGTQLLVIGSVIWRQNEKVGIAFAQRTLDHDLQVQQFLNAFLVEQP